MCHYLAIPSLDQSGGVYQVAVLRTQVDSWHKNRSLLSLSFQVIGIVKAQLKLNSLCVVRSKYHDSRKSLLDEGPDPLKMCNQFEKQLTARDRFRPARQDVNIRKHLDGF